MWGDKEDFDGKGSGTTNGIFPPKLTVYIMSHVPFISTVNLTFFH